MIVYLYGFDWMTYAGQVMPAFARWLITKDERLVSSLFEQTRCAQEEVFLPTPMQHLRSWLRAQAFVEKLPRGPQSRKEYEQLCSVEQFTALSDRYLHRHVPQLYQNSDALRTIWGAIIETHCLPWRQMAGYEQEEQHHPPTARPPLYTLHQPNIVETAQPGDDAAPLAGELGGDGQDEQEIRGELVSLLQAAGLTDLAREVDDQVVPLERFDVEPIEVPPRDTSREADKSESGATGKADERDESENAMDEDDLTFSTQVGGVEIGGAPDLLHLRGWLAGISLRAMALFEYLACGRRVMPFGCVAGEPYNYTGYLTPDEVQHLAACLHDVQLPTRAAAEQDQQLFHQQLTLGPINNAWESFRLVDEVLPLYAAEFLQAIRAASVYDLGLICCAE